MTMEQTPQAEQLELFNTRELYEKQSPEVLVSWRRQLLDLISDGEKSVHLINDVLDGYGATRYDDME